MASGRSTLHSRRASSLVVWWVLLPLSAAADVIDQSVSIPADGQLTQLVQASSLLAVENRNAVAGGASDLDGDGDLDVLLFHRLPEEPPFALINDGHGQLTDEAASRLPALSLGVTQSALLVDLDQDGDPDAYVGRQPHDVVWLNDGTGVFSDATATWLPSGFGQTTDLAAGDLTHDGWTDVGLVQGGTLHVLENRFGTALRDVTATLLPDSSVAVRCVGLMDADADADLDLVAAGDNSLYLMVNEGARLRLRDSRINPQRASVTDLAVGDLDGDGLSELVLSRSGQPLIVSLSQRGRFSGLGHRFAQLEGIPNSALLADLNVDQRLDIVLAMTGPDLVYMNPGHHRSWQADSSWLPPDNEASRIAFAGDFNGDGLADLYLANDGQDALYLQLTSPSSP